MSNHLRCGCEDGYSCTKTTLCHVQTAVEDYESEIWNLTEQLGNLRDELDRADEYIAHLLGECPANCKNCGE